MITVVPTIDVEGVHGTDPFAQFVLGDVGDDSHWGVYRLAEVFQRYGVSGTFFVDCYEHTFWGADRLEAVCQKLVDMNQDVQLHTHPAWRDDFHDYDWLRVLKKEKSYFPQNLDFMAKLSFEQQLEILEHGIDLLERWVGQKPVAHRSGGYSLNQDTVEALVKAGIGLDSSMNAAHTNSEITWSSNRVVCKNGLVELPVTLLNYCFEIPLGVRDIEIYSKTMKTDLDTCSVDEFISYIDQAESMGLKVMNLFMHSYSLLKFDLFYKKIEPETEDLYKLDTLLSLLSDRKDVQFMNCADFLQAYKVAPVDFDGPDGIPSVRVNGKIAHLAFQKGKNALRDFMCQRSNP